MRYAVFVDAGYLYAQGSQAIFGQVLTRASVQLNPSAAIGKLLEVSNGKTDEASLLRIYWYDGLLQGALSDDQQKLADSENVKLRLGIVNLAGQQKGVDSLIITDLVELARNHAISDAILLSGDEDLRIGVLLAQSFGVRVHIIGIAPSRGSQSHLLLQEVDTTTEWNKSDVDEFLSVRPEFAASLESLDLSAATAISVDADEALQQAVEELVTSLTENEIKAITEINDGRHVPRDYDRRVLATGRVKLGRFLSQSEKVELRRRFLAAVQGRAANLPSG